MIPRQPAARRSMPCPRRRAAAVAVFALLLTVSSRAVAHLAGSQPHSPPWQYAYVVTTDSGAEVCFIEASGCRIEKVTAPPVYVDGGDRSLIDASATSRRATVRAIQRLGSEDWEMVGAAPLYGNVEVQGIYFKRRQ